MKTRVLLFAIAWVALATGPERQGLKPRAEASDYPVTAEAGRLTIGATVLSLDQVRGGFSTELDRNYVVVEVGVFPKDGSKVDVGPGDFMLRAPGEEAAVRPAGPKAIAAVLQKGNRRDSGGRDITLYPTIGVGYESGPDWDGRRRGGWSTSTGVGVGVGGNDRPPVAATERDRKTMELELSEQQFPEKIIDRPVAGYLYFPVKPKSKSDSRAYELVFSSAEGKATLTLK